MGIKITELPTTAVNDADYIPVANTTSGTRKVLMEDVLNNASPDVDSALSLLSENPVQNKAVAAAVNSQSVAIANMGEDVDDLKSQIEQMGGGGQPVPVSRSENMIDTDKIYLYLGSETGYDYGYIYVYLNNAWTKTTLYGTVTGSNIIGSPNVANTASQMTDRTKIYVYTGSETGYVNGDWYFYDGTAWTDGGAYQSQAIGANSVTGAKISETIRSALLRLFQKVAFVDDDGQASYALLYNALYDVAVESVSAVFNQTDDIYLNNTLADLRQYLTVTVTYEDETSFETDLYELSGTLTAGVSTITVSAQGKTTTFTVDVENAYDITPALTDFEAGTGTATVIDSSENSIRVYTTSNGTFRGAYGSYFDVDDGCVYKITFDAIYVKGAVRFYAQTNESTPRTIVESGVVVSETAHYEHEVNLSEAAYIVATGLSARWILLVTTSTSTAGDATFKNLKIIKYLPDEEE